MFSHNFFCSWKSESCTECRKTWRGWFSMAPPARLVWATLLAKAKPPGNVAKKEQRWYHQQLIHKNSHHHQFSLLLLGHFSCSLFSFIYFILFLWNPSRTKNYLAAKLPPESKRGECGIELMPEHIHLDSEMCSPALPQNCPGGYKALRFHLRQHRSPTNKMLANLHEVLHRCGHLPCISVHCLSEWTLK